MLPNLLTRQQAMVLTSEASVKKVEALNCDYTSRCMQPHEDDELELSATIECKNADGDECHLTAYYYIDKNWVDSLDDDVEYFDLVDWDTALKGYAIY